MPPADVSSLLAFLVTGFAARCVGAGRAFCASWRRPGGGDGDWLGVGVGLALLAPSWASSALTMATETCLVCCANRPWPSWSTAYRLPAVAATAPSSHAPAPMSTLERTSQRLSRIELSHRKGFLNLKICLMTSTWQSWRRSSDNLRDQDLTRVDHARRAGRSRYVRSMAQLLLVEDDAAIRGALIRALTDRGHAVSSTPTAMEALQLVLDSPPDLVILDLGLPDLDGYEALRMLGRSARFRSSSPPPGTTRPTSSACSTREPTTTWSSRSASARSRPGSGRCSGGPAADGPGAASRSIVGGLRLDGEAHEAALDGTPLDLSRREFDLLYYLAVRAGQVVTKRELLTHVGGCRTAAPTRRSTCMSPGSGASSGRARSNPGTCIRSAVSG